MELVVGTVLFDIIEFRVIYQEETSFNQNQPLNNHKHKHKQQTTNKYNKQTQIQTTNKQTQTTKSNMSTRRSARKAKNKGDGMFALHLILILISTLNQH